MKTLYIMRHAKSSWDDESLSDFDRPLNKRGQHAAPLMGKFLNTKSVMPNLIMSSPANRAKMTAQIVADTIGYNSKNIKYEDKIYEANVFDLQGMVLGINKEIDTVMIIGHNPSLTSLINWLGDFYLDNLPTAGIFGLRFNSKWSQIQPKSAKVIFFETPKRIMQL